MGRTTCVQAYRLGATTVGWIAMKFGTDAPSPQRMNRTVIAC